VFAHVGMAEVWWARVSHGSSAGRDHARTLYQRYVEWSQKALTLLFESGALTDDGEVFAQRLYLRTQRIADVG
jgi:HEXXH motif-containing protein